MTYNIFTYTIRIIFFFRICKNYKLISANAKKYILSAEALPPGHIKVDTVAGTTPDLNNRDEYQILLPEDYVSALGYDDAAAIIGQTVTLGVVDQYRHETKIFTPKKKFCIKYIL